MLLQYFWWQKPIFLVVWMAFASNTATKNGKNGGTRPTIKKGTKMTTSPKTSR